MIKLGQKAIVKRNEEICRGEVIFVSGDGMCASFQVDNENYEIFFHENSTNGKHYTAMGNYVELR